MRKLTLQDEDAFFLANILYAVADKAERDMEEDPNCSTYPEIDKVSIHKVRQIGDCLLRKHEDY